MKYILPPFLYTGLQKAVHGEYEHQGQMIGEFLAGRDGMTIEIGCGTGLLSKFFKPGHYVGVDIDEDRIETAKVTYKGYEFHTIDLTTDTIPDIERFDFVLFHGAIHHIPDEGVHNIMQLFKDSAKKRGRPVEVFMIEPIFLKRIIYNIPGYILAKLDRGDHIRTIPEMIALFGGKVAKLVPIKGKWFWPVPGIAMTVDVPAK